MLTKKDVERIGMQPKDTDISQDDAHALFYERLEVQEKLDELGFVADELRKENRALTAQVETLTAARDAARSVCRDVWRMFSQIMGAGTEGEALAKRAWSEGFNDVPLDVLQKEDHA